MFSVNYSPEVPELQPSQTIVTSKLENDNHNGRNKTKQQKTIPMVYNISSSKAISPLRRLEELEGTDITYKVDNPPRRSVGLYEKLKTHLPLGKSPTVTLKHVDDEAHVTYQIMPNVLTETRLILQFFSDHYTNGVWVPESEEDKRWDTFYHDERSDE